jgi:hypothetical protein
MRWLSVACAIFLLLVLAGTAGAVNLGTSTGHFKLTYTGIAVNRDDAGLLDTLEAAYGRVNGYFGTCPGQVEVIIIDDGDMDRAGKEVDSFSAWNKLYSAVVLRRGLLNNRSALPVIAVHEMTHLAINDILCKKDPRGFQWMEEGLCTLISKEPFNDTDVSGYIVGHGFLDIAGIYGAVKDENASISKNGYMQSYSLVKYMAGRYGLDAVIQMMECPENGFEKAFRKSTGEDFGTFYKEWRSDVTIKASGHGNK